MSIKRPAMPNLTAGQWLQALAQAVLLGGLMVANVIGWLIVAGG